MKMPLFRKTVAAMIAAVAASAILPAAASTFTVGGSGNNFTISRTGDTSAAETVLYRTVPLSAFPGQHYTEKSGTLVFAPGQTTTNITVSVRSPSESVYQYQTGTSRAYRLEITDRAGAFLDSRDSSVSSGLLQFSAAKVSSNIVNLVTLSGGNFSSGMSSGKYLDVSYTPPSGQVESSGTLAGYVLIDDSYDYAQKPAPVSTADLINSTGAQADYLAALDYKIYATVCFTEKERDDGYQYLQIVAGNVLASYDTGADPNGEVKPPTNSVYKVCFELSDGSNAEGKAFFPHRYSSGTGEFSLSTGKLWQQKYKSGCQAGSSGAVVLPVTTSYITTRFDAGGDNDDTWGYKDFFVRMALCDTTTPSLSGAPVLAPGRYGLGNTFYVSVPFSEIVTVTGTPTLHSEWGDLSYVSGSGSNVLTFRGTIAAALGQQLILRTLEGTVKDLAGNALPSPTNLHKSFAATVDFPWPGAGTEADPYVITTTNQLNFLAARVNASQGGDSFDGKYFELGADIAYACNLTWDAITSSGNCEDNFTPIGRYGHPFEGHFDGKGHVISGIRMYKTNTGNDDQSVGLFGYVLHGTVKNVFLRNANIHAHTDLGGIVGFLTGGSVTDCLLYQVRVASLSVDDANRQIIVGHNDGGTISGTHYRDCCIGRRISLDNVNTPKTDIFALTTAADVTAAPATGESATIDGTTCCTAGSTVTLGYTGIVPENWILSYAATGGAAVNGATLTIASADTTVSASVTPITYTVRFDAPDADTGSMPDQTLTYDTPQALTSNVFTRAGYAFAGWRGADGTIYPDGAIVLNLTNAQNAVVSFAATWRIAIPYIDADGNEQMCTSYTILTNAACDVEYGESGAANWYVVTNAVTVGGQLYLRGTAHLILCDGATLAATNTVSGSNAIQGNTLTIYGQTNGTGAIAANGSADGIVANVTINGGNVAVTGGTRGISTSGFVTINGGNLTATGGSYGIYANGGTVTINGGTVTTTGGGGIRASNGVTINGGTVTATTTGGYGIHTSSDVTINGGTVTATSVTSHGIDAKSVAINGGSVTATGGTGIFASSTITLGWTNPTDSIYANRYGISLSSYVTVNGSLTDGGNIYSGSVNVSDLAGKTLRPAYSITLPEGVVAGGVITQIVNVAYALPGATVTLGAATPGYEIGTVIVNGDAVEPVDGTYSFTASAAVTVAASVTPITYTVHFDANGGTGTMPDQTFTYDAPQALASNAFTCTGLTFAGWDYAGAPFADGVTVLNLTNEQAAVVSLVAQWGIPYIDADGEPQVCTSFTALTNVTDDVEYGEWSEERWYVVTNDVTISGNLWFADDYAHLILCDGATLTVTNENGTAIFAAANLVLYGQSGGTGTLIANGSANGIEVGYAVTINGGTVNATGDDYGISGSAVAINGGTVNATGDDYGISGSAVAINGGTVTAIGGDNGIVAHGYAVTINGGTVNATGYVGILSAIDAVTINGGSIVATGDFCGIIASSVTINGGNVTATGVNGDGIYAHDDITLGCSDPTDSIFVSYSYSETGIVSVKNGQQLTDGTAIYEGEVDPGDIAGKTLWPCDFSWKVLQSQLDAGGTVTLPYDVAATNNDATLTVTNAVTLDLNGHTIDAYGRFCVIQVLEGGDLTLTNSVEGAGAVTGGYGNYGGGVYVSGGAFTMAGGSITNNYADSYGGGVYVTDSGTFTISGGEISKNYAHDNGGGVYVDGGAFTMNGGTISTNTADCYSSNRDRTVGGGGVFVTGGTFAMTGGEILGNAADSVISGKAYGGGVCLDGGTNTMTGGTISGNFVATTGDTGGTSASASWCVGGGVHVHGDGTFTMSGGEISGNTSSKCGGGVSLFGNKSVVMMTGGTISGNTALCNGAYQAYGGGGVYINAGTFTLANSVISGNSTSAQGGGVYVNGGTFTVSGSSVVSGSTNSVGAADNVYLPSGKEIAVSNLTAGARIGVTTKTKPTASESVAFATGASAGDVVHFFSDNPNYSVGEDNGQLYLTYSLVLPAYLDGADETVTSNWINWAIQYAAGTNAAYESCFLLNISPYGSIPDGASLLKVVDFQITESGYRFELESDVCDLYHPDDDSSMLCNGYAAVKIAADLGEFSQNAVSSQNAKGSAKVMTDPIVVDVDKITLPVDVTIDAATGHAVAELNMEYYLARKNQPLITLPSPPLFFRALLTPIRPDFTQQVLDYRGRQDER